jgi:hypothetical protein
MIRRFLARRRLAAHVRANRARLEAERSRRDARGRFKGMAHG